MIVARLALALFSLYVKIALSVSTPPRLSPILDLMMPASVILVPIVE